MEALLLLHVSFVMGFCLKLASANFIPCHWTDFLSSPELRYQRVAHQAQQTLNLSVGLSLDRSVLRMMSILVHSSEPNPWKAEP